MADNRKDQDRNRSDKNDEFGRGGMSEEEKRRAREKGGEHSHSGGRPKGS